MKKVLIAIISITLLLTAGCSTSQVDDSTSSETTVVSAEVSASFDMEESELRKKYLQLYKEKLSDEKFISNIEASVYEEYDFYIRNEEDGYISFYDSMYNEVKDYYYPIVLTGTEDIIIAYVDSYGCLCTYNASSDSYDYYSNIHALDEERIDSNASCAISFSNEKVAIWKFGEKVSEISLPSNTEYIGYSYWEGYIFRNKGDVYSVQVGDNGLTYEPIAHEVESVIVTNYKYTSDAWSQPLFLMQDGSIKVYCVWEGEGERDDKSHLVEPLYEGGWK